MAIQLDREDFRTLVDLLRQTHDFANVRDRRRLVEAALEGSERGPDLLAQLDLDGNPQLVAVEVVRRLAEFGQVAYGKEALGVLLNYIQPFLDQEPAGFIAELFTRYPMEGSRQPVAFAEGLAWRRDAAQCAGKDHWAEYATRCLYAGKGARGIAGCGARVCL